MVAYGEPAIDARHRVGAVPSEAQTTAPVQGTICEREVFACTGSALTGEDEY
ncbi:MAG: hypothetical protein ACK5LO_12350 [Leucobacter sp.]